MKIISLHVWWFPQKNSCHVWHGNHILIWCFTNKKKCSPTYLLVAPNKHTCAPKPFFQKLTAAPAQQLVKRCHSWQVEPLQA